jgi:methylated-DNA-protein-cysteine methyltransferase-like protein
MVPSTLYERIYAVVRRIPRGRVATYGQVALLAGIPGHARQIGYALHGLAGVSAVPWQRVVNREGRISPRRDPDAEERQRCLLEAEGVCFDAAGRIDLARFQWRGRSGGDRGEKAGEDRFRGFP